MPAKRVQHQSSPVQRDTGYAQAVINGLAAPENRSVVTAVGLFIAGVAFLQSSWSEFLLPA